MKLLIAYTLLFMSCLPYSTGQTRTVYHTTKLFHFHLVQISGETAIAFGVSKYLDKAGSGPYIYKTDTLHKISENEYKGQSYSLNRVNDKFILYIDKNKKLNLEIDQDQSRLNLTLNHAYSLKKYFDLSHRLNNEFPLNHYTFRNGFYAWDTISGKNTIHDDFVKSADIQIANTYDSVSKQQTAYTNTLNYIKANAGKLDYNELKDSLKSLPFVFAGESRYFEQSVYYMATANPENFFKILEDYPTNRSIIYFAVYEDKELMKQLKEVKGYDSLKKEFMKDYNFGKTMPYKALGIYTLVGGLILLAILSNK